MAVKEFALHDMQRHAKVVEPVWPLPPPPLFLLCSHMPTQSATPLWQDMPCPLLT